MYKRKTQLWCNFHGNVAYVDWVRIGNIHSKLKNPIKLKLFIDLTAKLLKQGYRYHKIREVFSKFYSRHYEMISKYNVEFKSLLHQGLSEPEF